MLTESHRDGIVILQTMIKRLLPDSCDEMRMRATLREAGDLIRELVAIFDNQPDAKPLVGLTATPRPPRPAPKAKARISISA